MERYIRGDKSPVPKRLDKYLNKSQIDALELVAQFGWTIAFIRRPLFLPSTVVMVNETGNKFGVLLEDGSLDQEVDLVIRDQSIDAARKPLVKKRQVKSSRAATASGVSRRIGNRAGATKKLKVG